MLPKALRLIRQYHKHTKIDLASKLGITKQKLSDIESGKSIINKDILEKYAVIYEIPASSLIFFSESINKDGKYTKKFRNKLAGKVLSILVWMTDNHETKIKA